MRLKLLRFIVLLAGLVFFTGKAGAQSFSFNCARDTMVPACPANVCITLKGVIPDIHRQTGTYTLNPTSHYQNGCFPVYLAPNDPVGTSTNLSVDDIYSPVINLPFPFPFYGAAVPYNSLLTSPNGFVSFDLANANLGADWAINQNLPSGTYDRAIIMGPFHDLDPTVAQPSQRIQYQVWGVAPHRRWILSYYMVPLFGAACGGLIENTHQIILYESTGIIEVTIMSKQTCAAWNSGRAIVGIQDFTRLQAMMAPGRTALGPTWSVANGAGESWRFVPSGGTRLFKRAELLDLGGTILATDLTPADLGNGKLEATFSPPVCPPPGVITSYIIRSVYESITNPAVDIFGTDTIRVNRAAGLAGTASSSAGFCAVSNGTITVNTVTGGDNNYLYSIVSGPTTRPWQIPNVFTGLPSGTYTVSVRDGSTLCTLTLTVVITAQTFNLPATATAAATSCSGVNNGSITVSTTAVGPGPYLVTLTGPTAFTGTVTLPHTIPNLVAGTTYTVVVTDPVSGCLSLPITNINVAVGTIGVTGDVISITPASCAFATNGTATVRPTAGIGPFTMQYFPGGSPITGITSPQPFINLPGGGGQFVIITDDLGCTSSQIPIVIPSESNSSTAVASASCGPSGGTITVTPTGGTAPYEYSIFSGPITRPYQISNVFTNVPPGTYTIRVSHGDQSCLSQTTVTVTPAAALAGTVTFTNITPCNGATNGSITITPTVGTGTTPYSYSIDGTTWVGIGNATHTFSGLAAGSYTVYFRDNVGCQFSQPVTITQPAAISFTTSSNPPICNGAFNGTTTVTVAGGGTFGFSIDGGAFVNAASPYTFINVLPGLHPIVVRNAFPPFCPTASFDEIVPLGPPLTITTTVTPTSCPGATNGSITVTPSIVAATNTYTLNGTTSFTVGAGPYTITGLTAGPYTLQDLNSFGCSSALISNIIIPPGPPLSATATPIATTCGGLTGGITISGVSGGASPYQYSLDGINWQSSPIFSGLPANSYTVRVRDAGSVPLGTSCSLTIPNVVVAGSTGVTAPPPTTTIATCGIANGTITVNGATGGTAPYEYSLDGITWQAGTTFIGVATGTYTVRIRDAGATVCTATINNVIVGQTTAVVAAGTSTTIETCGGANGSIIVNVPSGGTAPYQYSINGGTTWQAGTTFTGLASGSYTVTIRDAGTVACSTTIPNVNVGQTTAVTTAGTSTTIATCGGANGSITVNLPSGGTAPYQYSINGGTTWQAGTTFTGLVSGSYTVTIRDAGTVACSATIINVTVGQTSAVSATTAATGATCGLSNGIITVNAATGGTPPYEYSLDGIVWQVGNVFPGIAGGNYSVRVRDAGASCIFTTPVTVPLTLAVTATVTPTTATCGASTGSITVSLEAGGSGAPYQYSLDGLTWQIGNIFPSLAGGNYNVRVRDAAALCITTIPVTVAQTAAVTATTTTTIANCGLSSGSITVNGAAGGSGGPFQYSLDGVTWQPGNIFLGLGTGNYTVRVRDNAGICIASILETVGQTSPISATVIANSPATCGNSNGSISIITPSGGTAPYEYSLDGITWQHNNTFSGILGGNLTIRIRDASGSCTATISFTLSQTTAVAITSATPAPATCGLSNGSIVLSGITGGTPPYQYSIDGITWQFGNTFSGLAGGSYTISVRDNGFSARCTTTIAASVAQTAAITATTATTAANCGAATGSITINGATGGSGAPYQYSLDGITWQPANTFTGIAGGNYNVQVRDNGAVCSVTILVTVAQTGAVIATASATAAANCGASTGAITVSAPTGGTAPYEFSLDGTTWQPGNTFTGLAGGNYTVQVRDNGATCTITIPVTVAQTAALVATSSATAAANCGASTGIITVSAPTGGTAPYQYSLDGIIWQLGNTFTGLAGGSYTVRVRDNGAVCSITLPAVTVAQTAAVTATTTSTAANCGASTGSITINGAAGGTGGPYQYSLDGITWQPANTFTSLAGGNYNVQVRDNSAICNVTIPVTVAQTGAVTATASATAAANCGASTGIITLSAPTGGTAPYEFSLDGIAWQTGNTFTGLAGGSYIVRLRDAGAACITTLPVTVAQTAAVSATASATATSCGTSTGSITVAMPTGGTAPYQYSLDGITWQVSTIFPGLPTGNYTVTVRDAGTVVCSTTIPISVPQTGSLTATTTTATASCTGVNNGSITFTTAGGAGPYTFAIDGGAAVPGVLPYTFTNVGAGPHTVVVTDLSSGCNSGILNVTVAAGAGVTGISSSTATACPAAANGTITVTATSGTAPFTFQLDGGAFQSGASPFTFSNVAAGLHTVLIRDNVGCTVTINQTITPGATLAATTGSTPTSCTGVNNGTVTATPTNGTAPYSYSLDGAAFVAGAAPYTFTNLAPGAHTVVVRDAAGCFTNTINVTVTAGSVLTATATPAATSCSGATNGAITVTPNSGVVPYSYSLDGAAAVTGAAPYTFTNVSAGAHTIVMTDGAGCVTNLINVTVTAGSVLTATATPAATSCSGATNGAITVTPTSGVAPYSYSLDGGAGVVGAGPYTFNNVPVGPHTVVMTDVSGCVTNTINVIVTAGPALTTTVSKTDALCNGGATGTITVTQPVIGVAPYQYSLDGITWQASNVFAGLTAGPYNVFYRENNGCQGTQSITINEPAAVTGSVATVPVVCNGLNNGIITVAASGGVSPYQYSINGGTTWQNNNVFTVVAGNYTISIRDVNNCIITRAAIVTSPVALTVSSINVSASCNGGNDGVITVTANGGNAGYQYSLDGITFQASNVFNVGPGNFTVTVRDNLGCTTNFTTTVGLGSNFVLVAPPNPTICEGTSTQLLLNSNASQYTWTPATGLSSTTVANPFANPIVTTQYTVTATLGRCTGTATVTVNVNPAPIPNAGTDGVLCYGQTYQLQGSGGTQYSWSPATFLNNSSIANPVSSSTRNITYTLSILTDINGCASLTSDQVNIVVAPPITVRTFPYDTIGYAGDQFQLMATASDSTATNYSWNPANGLSNPAIRNPMVTVGATVGDVVRYQVIATTPAGCRGEGYVTVRTYKGPDIYVPTGFTPNGDGKNDRFTPFPVGMKSYNYFRIFNRWGQQVFSSTKLHDGWDGKLGGRDQQSGVFVWMIEGVTTDGRVITRKGTIALIR